MEVKTETITKEMAEMKLHCAIETEKMNRLIRDVSEIWGKMENLNLKIDKYKDDFSEKLNDYGIKIGVVLSLITFISPIVSSLFIWYITKKG